MLRSLLVIAIAAALSTQAASCGCNGMVKRPYPAPNVDTLLASLRERNQQAKTFRSRSTMDYWVGKDRVKGTVWVQGRSDRRLRFNALNPGSDTVAVDLACDGDRFVYLDQNNNCMLEGPCDASAIAQLLRVQLEPEDFLLLAIGSTPVLEGEPSLRWDDRGAREIVTIKAADGRVQTIALDGKVDSKTHKPTWDVLESKVVDGAGKVDWQLHNKGFSTTTAEDGSPLRVPGKTRFEQPAHKADLIVDWQDRQIGLALDDELFVLDAPAGLARCGGNASASARP